MHKEEIVAKIKELSLPILEKLNIDLADLICFNQGRRLVIRFLVDKPEGGINLEECAQLNSQLGEFFDKENIIEEGYTLEVSSPGVDRPLKTKKDFLRNLNKIIELTLVNPVNGKRGFVGQLSEVLDESIILDKNGQRIEILLTNISYAVQKI